MFDLIKSVGLGKTFTGLVYLGIGTGMVIASHGAMTPAAVPFFKFGSVTLAVGILHKIGKNVYADKLNDAITVKPPELPSYFDRKGGK